MKCNCFINTLRENRVIYKKIKNPSPHVYYKKIILYNHIILIKIKIIKNNVVITINNYLNFYKSNETYTQKITPKIKNNVYNY